MACPRSLEFSPHLKSTANAEYRWLYVLHSWESFDCIKFLMSPPRPPIWVFVLSVNIALESLHGEINFPLIFEILLATFFIPESFSHDSNLFRSLLFFEHSSPSDWQSYLGLFQNFCNDSISSRTQLLTKGKKKDSLDFFNFDWVFQLLF